MPRETLGEFEQVVLLAILQLEEAAYVVPIIAAIEQRTGRSVSHAAVYVALRRLEQKKLVGSRLGESTAQRGGRPKRYFSVHPKAITMLRESRDAMASMWDGLEPIA